MMMMRRHIVPHQQHQQHRRGAREAAPPPPRFGGCARRRRGALQTLAAPSSDTPTATNDAAVGIDLGTTNTVVAVLCRGERRPRVLRADGSGGALDPSPDAPPAPLSAFALPSVAGPVGGGGAWAAGAAARARLATDPLNTFHSAKRLLGRPRADAAAAWAAAAEAGAPPPAAYRLAQEQGPQGQAMLECPALGRAVAPEEVSAEVLKAALSLAEAYLGRRVPEAVVTVPAYFTREQRAATLEAARLAGLERASLLAEPVAAAIAFGFGRPAGDAQTLLVVDLGGGTYDVSAVEAFEGIMEVLATGGDNRLGGDDWDAALAALLRARLDAAAAADGGDGGDGGGGNGGSKDADAAAAADAVLLAAAEAAKVALSGADAVSVAVPNIAGAVEVTRRDFEAATAPLRARLWPPLAGVAADCKLELAADGPLFEAALVGGASSSSGSGSSGSSGSSSSSVKAAVDKYAPPPRRLTGAVLVGGATRMPAVRAFVEHVTGLEPRADVDPEQAVAVGAALHAGLLTGAAAGGLELMDGSYVEELQGRASGFQV